MASFGPRLWSNSKFWGSKLKVGNLAHNVTAVAKKVGRNVHHTLAGPGACPFWLNLVRTVTDADGALGKRST